MAVRMVAGAVLGSLLLAMPVYAQTFKGLCEASAAATVDDGHFAVASDETNVIRIYAWDDATTGIGVDNDTGFTKSDIEGAARLGDRIYWISSQSLNKNGKDKDERKVFFATSVMPATSTSAPTLTKVGMVSVGGLRDPLLAASGAKKGELNVEGLAAYGNNLLIGLRDTVDGKAVLIPFLNPAAVVDQGAAPVFDAAIALDLNGLGVRSIDSVGAGYLIVAGSVADGGDFVLFSWAGKGSEPEPVADVSFGTLHPEALLVARDGHSAVVLSDDDACSDETDALEDRAFRFQTVVR